MTSKLRRWLGVGLTTAAGLALPLLLAKILDADAPLFDSALSPYLIASAVSGLFVAASLSVGLRLARWLLPGRLRWEERLSVGFAFGVLAFQAAVFLAGLLGLLTQALALLLAGALFVAGLPELLRLYRRCRAIRRRAPRAARVERFVLLSCLGVPTLLVLGAHALTSSSIGYDASWYHLPIAEAYAATGAIRPFPEGWMLGTYPQLASILYSWALVVTRETALGWTSCAFLELSLVVAAILGIVPLLRALLPGERRAGWAWATIALFPGVYLYPPRIEADYIAASFAAPLLIVAFKAWHRLDRRILVAGALLLAGPLLVKYSAISVCGLPLLLVLASVLRDLWQRRGLGLGGRCLELAKATGLAALVFLLATSSHWLKNLLAYGDPIFPNHSPGAFTPVTRGFYQMVIDALWQPAPGTAGWWETAQALFTFSFKPHEYSEYNAGHPIFGSLFTLTLLPLLVLRRGRRLLLVHLGTLLGVAIWFRLHHQDRYLLVLIPWMCAVTAGTLRELWRVGVVQRSLVVATCALQLWWGARWGLKLFPLDAVRAAVLAPSLASWRSSQLARWAVLYNVGQKLGPNATVLIHDERIRLGLRRRSVTDTLGFETRLSFAELASNERIYDALKALGVTHLYAPSSLGGSETVAGDLVYYAFFHRLGQATADASIRAMPRTRPPAGAANDRLVFIDACGAMGAAPGLYRVSELTDVSYGAPPALHARPLASARSRKEAAELVARAEFLISSNSCSSAQRQVTNDGFTLVANRTSLSLYLRDHD